MRRSWACDAVPLGDPYRGPAAQHGEAYEIGKNINSRRCRPDAVRRGRAAADISGAGATFPYPIYAKWADAYKKQTGIGLNYQSIGSGGGIKQIKAKTVTFGASECR